MLDFLYMVAGMVFMLVMLGMFLLFLLLGAKPPEE